MPSLLLSLALALGAPAAASKLNDDPSVPPVESSQTLPVDDPAPAEPAAVPLEDREATHAPQEGIWAWVVRLEGEILTPEMKRAIVERAREKRDQDAAGADGPADKADGSSKVASAKPAKTGPVVLSELDPDDYDIPLATNAHVRRWVNYFTGKGRPHFQRYLDRSAIYRPMMEAKLEAAGQPKDLVYLAMIESGFNAHALSHAGAGGLWQFMPATGRMYKLRVDWWVDDRRDPVKSTDAAVAHLGDLHKMFKGDWYLAWGAYNAGPGRIRGAMRRAGASDFWKLVKGGHLPSETANYAPKLIAAAIVAKNAEQYGFTIKPATPYNVDTVKVDGAATLGLVAELSGQTIEEVKALNPALRRSAIPQEGYLLNLPAGTGATFSARLAKVPPSKRVQFVNHTVRKGETLSKIAARYDTTSRELVRLNHLKNADRIHVGMTLVIPSEGTPVPPAPRTASAPKPAKQAPAKTVAKTQPESAPAASSGKGSIRYSVRRGDTLSAIASRHNVSTADLTRWNRIKSASSIQAGQVLTIHRTPWRSYRVKPGDSLGRIAQSNGCSVTDLRSWNGLKGDVIQPGQNLRIRR